MWKKSIKTVSRKASSKTTSINAWTSPQNPMGSSPIPMAHSFKDLSRVDSVRFMRSAWPSWYWPQPWCILWVQQTQCTLGLSGRHILIRCRWLAIQITECSKFLSLRSMILIFRFRSRTVSLLFLKGLRTDQWMWTQPCLAIRLKKMKLPLWIKKVWLTISNLLKISHLLSKLPVLLDSESPATSSSITGFSRMFLFQNSPRCSWPEVSELWIRFTQ